MPFLQVGTFQCYSHGQIRPHSVSQQQRFVSTAHQPVPYSKTLLAACSSPLHQASAHLRSASAPPPAQQQLHPKTLRQRSLLCLARKTDLSSDASAEDRGVPWTAVFLWGCSFAYWWLFFASSGILPGGPAWEPHPEGVSEILNESINFWYVNILYDAAGWPAIPNEAQHPVSEAIFNFAGAYSFLIFPLIIYDNKFKRKVSLWTAILFLTNFLMWPAMAIRADHTHKHDKDLEPNPTKVPLFGLGWIPWAPAVAWTCIALALFSIWWGLYGRPEFGDLASRWEFLKYATTHDRAFDVSLSDITCYSLWQTVLMDGVPAKYRYVPFIGPAAWLVNVGAQRKVVEEAPARHQR